MKNIIPVDYIMAKSLSLSNENNMTELYVNTCQTRSQNAPNKLV